MNLSARTEYACVALVELALRHGPGEPVRIRSLAEAHGIPSRFLVQILLQLKGAGLVCSTRGAAGGYRLACPPQQITLADIVQVIEGPLETPPSTTHDNPVSRSLQQSWREVTEVQREILAAVSLADLTERVNVNSENMYYI